MLFYAYPEAVPFTSIKSDAELLDELINNANCAGDAKTLIIQD